MNTKLPCDFPFVIHSPRPTAGLYLAKQGEYFSAEGERELQEEQPPQL